MAVAKEAFQALCMIGIRGDQLTIKYFGANGTVHDLECEIESIGQTGLQVRSADNTSWISAWTVVGWTVVGHREQAITTALPDSPTTTFGQPSESVQRRLTTDLPGVAISNIGQLLGSGGAGDTDGDEPDGSGATTEGISQSHRDRKPLEERLRGLPKGNSSYARAKREEQLDNLEAAEALFRQTIAGHGIYRKSAIKDLAMLLNRLERFTDAINVLADHRSLFTGPDEPGLLQSYKAVFLKSKQFAEALTVIRRLEQLAISANDRRVLGTERASVLLNLGRVVEVLDTTAALLSRYPGDQQLTGIRERALNAASNEDVSNSEIEVSIDRRSVAITAAATPLTEGVKPVTVQPGSATYTSAWALIQHIEPRIRELVATKLREDPGPEWADDLPRQHPTLGKVVIRMRERGAANSDDMFDHAALPDLTTIMSVTWHRYRRAFGGMPKERFRQVMFKIIDVRNKLAHIHPVELTDLDDFVDNCHKIISLLDNGI